MSDTKEEFENVFKNDSETLQKYKEKFNKIVQHKTNIRRADFPYALLQAGSAITTIGTLVSLLFIVKAPMLTIGLIIACALSWISLHMVVATFEKDKKAIKTLEESIDEDVRQKVAQDLKNLYGAQLSETKPQPDVLSGKPNNEIVLENGDLVSAFLSYDNDGVLTARVQSKIKNLEVKDDYAKELKKKHDVIEGLNDLK